MTRTFVTLFLLLFALSSTAYALDVSFADSKWDGMKIPSGQQCQKFGGMNPATPSWNISNIPVGSDSILLEYSDRDSKKMDNGGHGRMLFSLDGTTSALALPPVPGHTFVIAPPFTIVEAHRGAGWDIDGAYMPPCSGGKNHAYYVTIKTLKGKSITAEAIVEMGSY